MIDAIVIQCNSFSQSVAQVFSMLDQALVDSCLLSVNVHA